MKNPFISLLLLQGILAGCGVKGPIETAPMDEATKAFVTSLTALHIRDRVDVLQDEIKIVQNRLSFRKDGSFQVEATVNLAGEDFPCAEAGRWVISEGRALSSSEGILELETTSSNCPGVRKEKTRRLRITITPAGEYEWLDL